MEKDHKIEEERREYAEDLIEAMARDPRVLRMKNYIQHGRVTTYDHVLNVARTSCRLAVRWGWDVDLDRLVRGAVLHDYYLYDWHNWGGHLHGYKHPKTAADRAGADFGLDRTEKQIIRSHMWPLTLLHPPASREALLVCIADKICSTEETLKRR